MPAPLASRLGALICGVLYLPLGLVWAYGVAVVFLPLPLIGFWLLYRADREEARLGIALTKVQARLRAFARGVLFTALAVSVVALIVTR